jgi:hypothetical protein
MAQLPTLPLKLPKTLLVYTLLCNCLAIWLLFWELSCFEFGWHALEWFVLKISILATGVNNDIHPDEHIYTQCVLQQFSAVEFRSIPHK